MKAVIKLIATLHHWLHQLH